MNLDDYYAHLKLKKLALMLLNKSRYSFYSLLLLFLGLLVNPAFAEVTSIQSNNESFEIGDKIEFSGTVEKGSIGLVTIVIRDLNNEFVQLTQATIDYDDTFEKSVEIGNRFTQNGIYNATGFILNMTQGVTSEFNVSFNENQIINNNQNIPVQTQHNSPIGNIKVINTDFVDSSKDPSYYIQRYYSEPAYKSWFDRNYPGQSIEETVGYTDKIEKIKTTVHDIIDKEIIPEAQASSIVEPSKDETNNSDIAQISLAIAALGILFGAVYGVKRQVDNNSRQISINKDTIRKKIIRPIMGSNPKEIIQTRLAKGEITLEEYEQLERKFNKFS